MADRLLDRLPCITIKQPWASAIAECHSNPDAKNIENRVSRSSRSDGQPVPPTRYRGLVGIHAGKAWSTAGRRDPRVRHLLRRHEVLDDRYPAHRPRLYPEDLPAGEIIATAQLVDVHLSATTGDRLTPTCCHPWGDPGVWHLVLADVVRLADPVPTRGALGLPWRADEATTAVVLDQIAAVGLSR